jgi:hypothetical protein
MTDPIPIDELFTIGVLDNDTPCWVGPLPLWTHAVEAAIRGEIQGSDGLGDLLDLAQNAVDSSTLTIARHTQTGELLVAIVYVGVPAYVALLGDLDSDLVAVGPVTREIRDLLETMLA